MCLSMFLVLYIYLKEKLVYRIRPNYRTVRLDFSKYDSTY